MTSRPSISISAPQGTVVPPAQPELLLGRYRPIETRDSGGFGTVIVAWDVRLQRRVAIKQIATSVEDGAWTTFDEALAEARASSFLTHSNIVTVHDFEVDDTYAYLVMEYVDGCTLAELLQRVEGGVLVWDEVAYLLDALADALAFAHNNGVLHLDIKPANVLIDHNGTVKLADFGMALLVSAAGWGDARGGTVGYMPPEQLTGQMVDERADVWALAAVCYEALTGTAPFIAPTAEGSLKLIERGAAPISNKEPELAGPVELAFETALSPSAADRMASIEELAGEIVPSLGNPHDGRRSLAHLMEQGEKTTEAFDEAAWRALDPPGRRIPWLAGALTRVISALVVGALAALCLAPWQLGGGVVWLGALAAGALAAIWPQVGAAATLALVVLDLVALNITPAHVLMALISGGLSGLWLARVAGQARLSAVALLLGATTGLPFAGAPVAGYALPPLAAAATALLGCFIGIVLPVSAPFSSVMGVHAAAEGLLATFSQPGTWIFMAGAGLAALVCSIASRPHTTRWCITGQILGAIVFLVSQFVTSGLENGGIWAAPAPRALLIALVSWILMTLIVVLFGPSDSRREGDARELS